MTEIVYMQAMYYEPEIVQAAVVAPPAQMALPTCFVPPPIASTPLLINDGEQPFGTQIGLNYVVAYSSKDDPHDIIGNLGITKSNWNPVAPNTDPPSHFELVLKDFAGDCAFFPVAGIFDGKYSMAWLESTPSGKLNLKFSDQPILLPPGDDSSGTPPPGFGLPKTFYFYPNLRYAQSAEQTSNVPMSDITVVDTVGNLFKIDLTQMTKRGVAITMTYPISKVRWTQTFREPQNNLFCQLTTIYTEQNPTAAPLPNIAVNIYENRNLGVLWKRVFTDAQGAFKVTLRNVEYLFEIEIDNLNFSINQKLL